MADSRAASDPVAASSASASSTRSGAYRLERRPRCGQAFPGLITVERVGLPDHSVRAAGWPRTTCKGDLSPATEILTLDVVIIGAGPVGLFAVFECGMLGMSCHVIDVLDAAGGQCRALPGEADLRHSATPRSRGRARAETSPNRPRLRARLSSGHQVVGLTPQNGGRLADLERRGYGDAAAIIIAAGVGAFGPTAAARGHRALRGEAGRRVCVPGARREDYRGRRWLSRAAAIWRSTGPCRWPKWRRSVAVVHRAAEVPGGAGQVRQLHALAESGGRAGRPLSAPRAGGRRASDRRSS